MPKINTYTDNATIEDVDAVLTYDPAGSGATKLTTFGRIATWISTKLAGLAKKTTISSADQILMVNGSAANRIDYNVLAKAILEEYAASTLAGSARSVKSALDAVSNSTTPKKIASNTDLDTLATKGHYYTDSTVTGLTNSPVAAGIAFSLAVLSKGTYMNQFLIANNNHTYYRTQFSTGWQKWREVADQLLVSSKAEFIEALSSMAGYETRTFYGSGTFLSDMTGGELNVGTRGIISRSASDTYDFILSAAPKRLLIGRYTTTTEDFEWHEYTRRETFYFGNTTGTHDFTIELGCGYLVVVWRVNGAGKLPVMYLVSAYNENSVISKVTSTSSTFDPTVTVDKLTLTVDTGAETFVKVSLVKLA